MQRFTKYNLPVPVEEMPRYRKTTTTPMWPVTGPCVFVTQEGESSLPEEWVGYCAVDDKGFPYPVAWSTQQQTYEEVPR